MTERLARELRIARALRTIRSAYEPLDINMSPESSRLTGILYRITWAAGRFDDHTDETLFDVANDPATQEKLGASWLRV